MGKLHKLKKKIVANPEPWVREQYGRRGGTEIWARPAHIESRWYKDEAYAPGSGRNTHSYRAFVRSVLRELGYDVK